MVVCFTSVFFVILRNEGTHQKLRIATLQYFVELLVCSFVPQDDKILGICYVYSAVWFNVFCQCFVILRNEGTHQKFRIATLQNFVELLECSFVPQDDKIVGIWYVWIRRSERLILSYSEFICTTEVVFD